MINGQTKVSDLTVADLETILTRGTSPDTGQHTATLLDTRQARVFLSGISKHALYYQCAHNRIPHIRQGGRLYFFKDDLLQWKIQNGWQDVLFSSQNQPV
ncbi:helix-turn-helix domain-containing protein [Dyadobacter psychrotolerans]|uniref:DNA-binding protein n=1 Tax=Dyadobacter psychrotolerans TaxID=2541721 RepID=A0A4R5D7B4_9BACT|nr:helix-turn-helix domain-containing protein [Dyadobacter psychrotolerans]TDE08527.1 DNA-binding protein [Dyadobacter psychrotolerans]